MNPFELYKISRCPLSVNPNRPEHPTRPWWIITSLNGDRWRTTPDSARYQRERPRWYRFDCDGSIHKVLCMFGDGGDHDAVALEAYDLEHPAPQPPVLCGQVWAYEREETTISHGGMTPPGRRYRMIYATPLETPPADALLVAGPWAPWAPPGWKPDRVLDPQPA